MKKYAVIVAGGRGERMNSAIPKQFLPLLDKPILYYSIKAFLDTFEDIHIILVLPEEQLSYAQMVLQAFPDRIDATIITGGETRFHSVLNGLNEVREDSVVFVHDGVRPLASPMLIRRCYDAALEKGSAIPAVRVTDSMRFIEEDASSDAIDRDRLCIVQTPQTFRSGILLPAFQQPYHVAFTDEATVVEAYGTKVYLVEGERSNIKLTTPEDMIIAEALMKERLKDG
jgi:2-C-methyl-D-erythritol 4-phosphate cytidylyltransferase